MRPVAIGSRAEHGSSMRITSGSTAMARAMHRPLLLATRQAHGRGLQPVLHLVPQRRRRSERSTMSSMSPLMPATFGP